MRFAFGVGDYLSDDETIANQLDYGSVKLYVESWNETDNIITELPSRPCVVQDFGIDANSSYPTLFFDADVSKIDEFKRKMPVMMCVTEPISLLGNWNTADAGVLTFYFEKCDKTKRKTCKSDA